MDTPATYSAVMFTAVMYTAVDDTAARHTETVYITDMFSSVFKVET